MTTARERRRNRQENKALFVLGEAIRNYDKIPSKRNKKMLDHRISEIHKIFPGMNKKELAKYKKLVLRGDPLRNTIAANLGPSSEITRRLRGASPRLPGDMYFSKDPSTGRATGVPSSSEQEKLRQKRRDAERSEYEQSGFKNLVDRYIDWNWLDTEIKHRDDANISPKTYGKIHYSPLDDPTKTDMLDLDNPVVAAYEMIGAVGLIKALGKAGIKYLPYLKDPNKLINASQEVKDLVFNQAKNTKPSITQTNSGGKSMANPATLWKAGESLVKSLKKLVDEGKVTKDQFKNATRNLGTAEKPNELNIGILRKIVNSSRKLNAPVSNEVMKNNKKVWRAATKDAMDKSKSKPKPEPKSGEGPSTEYNIHTRPGLPSGSRRTDIDRTPKAKLWPAVAPAVVGATGAGLAASQIGGDKKVAGEPVEDSAKARKEFAAKNKKKAGSYITDPEKVKTSNRTEKFEKGSMPDRKKTKTSDFEGSMPNRKKTTSANSDQTQRNKDNVNNNKKGKSTSSAKSTWKTATGPEPFRKSRDGTFSDAIKESILNQDTNPPSTSRPARKLAGSELGARAGSSQRGNAFTNPKIAQKKLEDFLRSLGVEDPQVDYTGVGDSPEGRPDLKKGGGVKRKKKKAATTKKKYGVHQGGFTKRGGMYKFKEM